MYNYGRFNVNILTMTAMPLRSDPDEAAVGDMLGTVAVDVSLMWILDMGRSSTRLATYTQGWHIQGLS